jgi:hypothetical protein
VVFTLGNGVNGFTLDEQIGEFILTHPNIKIPNRGKVSYAANCTTLCIISPSRIYLLSSAACTQLICATTVQCCAVYAVLGHIAEVTAYVILFTVVSDCMCSCVTVCTAYGVRLLWATDLQLQ